MKGIDGLYIISEPLTMPYAIKTFVISSDMSKEHSFFTLHYLKQFKLCNIFFILGISFKQLAQQILPLASCYSMTVRFVEEKVLPDDGQVNHALRGAIRSLLKDYLV